MKVAAGRSLRRLLPSRSELTVAGTTVVAVEVVTGYVLGVKPTGWITWGGKAREDELEQVGG